MRKVTVYIPSYNYGRYLDRAIQSVLKQSMEDWDLIIIDDGSTDDTQEVLGKYRNHSKIRIVEQENRGLNVTNNIAVRLANGRYIMRLDADDYVDENILLILSNVLDTRPEVGLVYPDYYRIDDQDEILEVVRRKKIDDEVELLDLPAHGACTMIRKENLIEVGGYSEEFRCQDGYDLWLKMIASYRPYNVNIPLFYYRQHGHNMTSQQGKILATRAAIKRRFVESEIEGQVPRVLGLVSAIGRSVYPQSHPFVQLAGKPLIWYTISEVLKSKLIDRVVVSSEDDAVLEYASKFPDIVPLKRSAELTKSTARREDIAQEVLTDLKAASGYEPDAVCTLSINTPLRRADHIDRAIDTMIIFGADSVVSVQEELGLFYRHLRLGLAPLGNSGGTLRLERDALYKANGAIHLTRTHTIQAGQLDTQRIGHITMLPEESIKTNSEFELWLAEKIFQGWLPDKDDAEPSGMAAAVLPRPERNE